MSEGLRSRPPEELRPYEAVLRSFAYHTRFTPEELTAGRTALEITVRKAPTYADAWAMLSFLCAQDYVHGYELQPDALATAVSAARRAVELGPSNHLAYYSLAQALAFRREVSSFRDAAERAVELNPMDGNTLAILGELLTYAGDAERGMQLAQQAKQLNPNHPGSYWYADFYHAFDQGDYRTALNFALKAQMRGNPLAPMFITTAYGHLGDLDAARKAAADLLQFRPELPALMRKQVAKVWNPEYGERFLEGLRIAGLDIPPKATTSSNSVSQTTTKTDSSTSRAGEGFWIAVLPFKHKGQTEGVEELAEGLTDAIVTGLSRFHYLKVIARASTTQNTGDRADIRAIGKELGARYVMEGVVRPSGSKLRLAVQLIDAATGAHLWAESYERNFSPETLFDLQDDLAPRIVSTIADMNGVLTRSMSEEARSRDPESLTTYEAVLRAFAYGSRATAEELSAAVSALKAAVEKNPSYGDGWGSLGQLYGQDFGQGFNLYHDSLARALSASQRSIELAPTNYIGYCALAQAQFFLKDFQSFRNAAQRAVTLNPMDGNSIAILGELLTYAGDAEQGLAWSARAKQLNPAHPGWYWNADFYNAFNNADYRTALNFLLKVNLPGHWFLHAATAAACGHLGEKEMNAKSIHELLKLRPDFTMVARRDAEKWWNAEYVERLVEGWRKAGLPFARVAE
jgi:TolB-like protein/cytochrome c-type biogenesis protein CcmH/NrfG